MVTLFIRKFIMNAMNISIENIIRKLRSTLIMKSAVIEFLFHLLYFKNFEWHTFTVQEGITFKYLTHCITPVLQILYY